MRRRLNENFRQRFGDVLFHSDLNVDAEVQLDAIDELLAEEVGRMEPFGIGNPEPILAVRGATLERARVVGENHLQVTLRDGLHARDGIGLKAVRTSDSCDAAASSPMVRNPIS